MTLTGSVITAVCESLLNPAGRFRTLKQIAPFTDSTGQPRFTVTSCTVDFEVQIGGTPHLLKVPFGPGSEEFATAAETASSFPTATVPFIIPWHYHRREMLLFTGHNIPVKTDVLTEAVPQGMPLRNFIRTHLHSEGLSSIRQLLVALSELYSALESSGTVHGHIRTDNITVHDGRVGLSGYIHSHERRFAQDTEALLMLAVISYTTACEPPLFPRLWQPSSADKRRALFHSLQIQGQFDRNDALIEVVKALQEKKTPDPLHAENLLRNLSVTPFYSMPLLRGLLSDATELPSICTARDITVKYNAREIRLPDTFIGECEYVGPVSENMVRYLKDGKWGFADSDGHRICSEEFTAAGDFYEGRAAVVTTQGAGLLGKDGSYIMQPIYEALEWYGSDNIAAACRDGIWNLYDRTGEQLTVQGYEWMSEPSEGLVVVKRRDKFGYISTSGAPITQMRFDEAFSFRDGNAVVESNGEIYRIDREGRKIV